MIDNLPPALIGRIAELAGNRDNEMERFCFVVGRGGSESIPELVPAVAVASSHRRTVRLLFRRGLGRGARPTIRRRTRRRHPVGATPGVLQKAIRAERRAHWLDLRQAADIVIDTSDSNSNDLRADPGGDLLFDGCGRRDGNDGRLVRLQARAPTRRRPRPRLPLPAEPALDRGASTIHRAGRTRSRLRARPAGGHRSSSDRVEDLCDFLLPAYAREGKSYLSSAIGCTGGQHRSVVIAEELARRITSHGLHCADGSPSATSTEGPYEGHLAPSEPSPLPMSAASR